MNKSKTSTRSETSCNIIFVLLCISLFMAVFMGFFTGCSLSNDDSFINDSFIKEDENQFAVIEDTDKYLCEESYAYDSIRLIYDRETFMVYYNINSTYNHNISPYLINGHFAKYDPESNSIVEIKNDINKDN